MSTVAIIIGIAAVVVVSLVVTGVVVWALAFRGTAPDEPECDGTTRRCPAGQKCSAAGVCVPDVPDGAPECTYGDHGRCTTLHPGDATRAYCLCSAAGTNCSCGPQCRADHDCTGPNRPADLRACRLATNTCVQCTRTEHCAAVAGKPACRVADNTCVQCVGHGDCPAGSYCQDNACKELRQWRHATLRLRSTATDTCLCTYPGGSTVRIGPGSFCIGGDHKLSVSRTTNRNWCKTGGDGGVGGSGIPTCDADDRTCAWYVERVTVPSRPATDFVVRLRRLYDRDWCAWVNRDYDDGQGRASQDKGWVRQLCGDTSSLFLVHAIQPPAGSSDGSVLEKGSRFRLRPLGGDGSDLGLGDLTTQWPWWTKTGKGLEADGWVVDTVRDVAW
jgi:hypothetical protein